MSSIGTAAVSSGGFRRQPEGRTVTRPRLDSIDLLRGIVMVVMALDHTRDFVNRDALRFDPTDLAQTTTALFLTRWVTHFCAPTFVFLAGVSAYLQRARGATPGELSRFLFTRGLWLIVLEFTVMRVGMWFNVDYSFLGLMQVIWVIGVSMVVLAALVHLPLGAIAVIGLAMIVLHNTFDGVQVPPWQGPGSPAPAVTAKLWMVLHQGGIFPLFGGSGPIAFALYPLIPWIGVMAAGYAFGTVYDLDANRRRRVLVLSGTTMIAAFVALRVFNIYGDAQHWQPQASAIFTVLSFVNVTKYPPSLLFLLLTLGPAMLALAWFEGHESRSAVGRAFVVFGRVPLFFYILQWPLAHGLAVVLSLIAGKDARYLFQNPPAAYTSAPPDAGFSLGVTYLCWAAVVFVLFVLCRWYAEVKRRSPSPLLRYL